MASPLQIPLELPRDAHQACATYGASRMTPHAQQRGRRLARRSRRSHRACKVRVCSDSSLTETPLSPGHGKPYRSSSLKMAAVQRGSAICTFRPPQRPYLPVPTSPSSPRLCRCLSVPMANIYIRVGPGSRHLNVPRPARIPSIHIFVDGPEACIDVRNPYPAAFTQETNRPM